MNNLKNAGFYARFCLFGSLFGVFWALLNIFYPNSSGTVYEGDFIVLVPWLHRFEHASAALVVYPAIFAGLFAFYLIGAAGKGWFAKIVLILSVIGVVLSSLSSLVEIFLLQWQPADDIRAYGFVLLLLLLCPLLWGIGALMSRTIPLWKRLLPFGLVVLFFAASIVKLWLFGIEEVGLDVILILMGWSAFGYAINNETKVNLS